MPNPATIRDVAEEAGVSIAVVSRVINVGSGPVAPATRERVIQAIEKLNYSPRTAARELKSGPTATLGLLLPDVTNPFFARLADRIVWGARSRGVQVILMTTQEDPRLEEEALATLASRRVTGIVGTPTATNAAAWDGMARLGTRVAFIDRFLSDTSVADVVHIDGNKAVVDATSHLVELGHSRIGFITGPMATSTGRTRTVAHTEYLESRGIEVDSELIRNVPFRGNQGGDAVASLLDMDNPPTALIMANTAQVVNSMRTLRQRAVSIPAELSVIVFDDDPWTELFQPALTAVQLPTDMLALHALELVLSPEPSGQPRSIPVEAEFVVRSSTGRPRS
jgi:LacI family transcriptional regulator